MTKHELLNTGYFIDNEYLDHYIELVNFNSTLESTIFTQEHHILPKTFFKHFNKQVDNTKNNLVNLMFKDHVKAHYLLSFCTTGFLKRNNIYALHLLINGDKKRNLYELSEQDFEELQELYTTLISNIDKESFINYYVTHTCKETALNFGIGLNTVTKLATTFDCLKNKKSHKSQIAINKSDLIDYYITKNNTLKDTAIHFGVDKSTIIRSLKKYNLNQTKNRYRHDNRIEYNHDMPEKAKFSAYYAEHNIEETAIHFNLGNTFCKTIIARYGLSKLKNYDHKLIYEYYLKNGVKQTIANFGVSRTQLYRIIHKEEKINDKV